MRLKLTQNKFAEIDGEDFTKISYIKWHYGSGGYAVGWSREKNRKLLCLHRLIIDAPTGKFVDHINGNKLDNRRSNLRLATASQNQWNRGLSKNNTTGFVGVSFIKKISKYQATVTIEGKNYNCGLFENMKDAIDARNSAIIYRGEFGRRQILFA